MNYEEQLPDEECEYSEDYEEDEEWFGPEQLIFSVHENFGVLESLVVAITPEKYFEQHDCMYDQELYIIPEPKYLAELTEGMYEVIMENATIKLVTARLLADGFKFNKRFEEFMNNMGE